ncbi:MAG: hypothetical protein WA952_05600, partial [Lewinella sp.]
MTRLATSFMLALLLAIGLLTAYLRESYVDARDLLVERIEGDLTQLSSDNLLKQIEKLQFGRPDSLDRDTVIEFTS